MVFTTAIELEATSVLLTGATCWSFWHDVNAVDNKVATLIVATTEPNLFLSDIIILN